jgi:hypothetical protein
MPLKVDARGLGSIRQGLGLMRRADCLPLMVRWSEILVEGNRRGVLSGVDGHDRPMPPLKYRNGAGKATKNRKRPMFGKSLYEPMGSGPFAVGLHGNLTTSQYKQLTGPRLAPRGEASRVIKNLHAEARNPAKGRWEAVAAWLDVVSVKGVAFLPFHFDPQPGSRLPQYDLRPVRAEDYRYCLNALRDFARQTFFARLP